MNEEPTQMQKFKSDLAAIVNRNGMDARINLPDYIIADYIADQLVLLGETMIKNEMHNDLED